MSETPRGDGIILKMSEAPRGAAHCGKIPGRFSGRPWPEVAGVDNKNRFNVCSWSKQVVDKADPMTAAFTLSPMFIGPFPVTPDHNTVTNIENFWQASKVWPGEETPGGSGPNSDWYERRKTIWQDKFAHRHIKRNRKRPSPGDGPVNPNVPLYSWWCGRKLKYHDARVRMYIPMYAEYVQQTPAYRALEAKVAAGESVLLVGHDGYDGAHTKAHMEELLRRGFRETDRDDDGTSVPFGHELVLCCLLNGTPVWEEWPGLETGDDRWWKRWGPIGKDFVDLTVQKWRQVENERRKQLAKKEQRDKQRQRTMQALI